MDTVIKLGSILQSLNASSDEAEAAYKNITAPKQKHKNAQPKLKECPFCGGDAEFKIHLNTVFAGCTSCRIYTGMYSINNADGITGYFLSAAIWNRRST